MDLLTKGKTGIIKNFKSKTGKSFDAALKFDADYQVVFDFPERKGKK
jgi:DNA topoisomerase-3